MDKTAAETQAHMSGELNDSDFLGMFESLKSRAKVKGKNQGQKLDFASFEGWPEKCRLMEIIRSSNGVRRRETMPHDFS